jgi:UDP-glucuronate decarboxylase
MLGLAKRVKAKIFQASTSEVYGDALVHPQKEDYWGHVNPIGPRSCYDEGKRCAETLFMDYRRQHGLSIRIARIFNTYGPRMHPADGRVVSNFMMQALRGEPLTLYGDGSQTRSFCYVDDMIDAFIRLMNLQADPGGPVNLGNPHEVTMREIAQRIVTVTGSGSPIELRPLPVDDPWHRQPDITRARDLFGWQPHTLLDDGLNATASYFRARIDAGESALSVKQEDNENRSGDGNGRLRDDCFTGADKDMMPPLALTGKKRRTGADRSQTSRNSIL